MQWGGLVPKEVGLRTSECFAPFPTIPSEHMYCDVEEQES